VRHCSDINLSMGSEQVIDASALDPTADELDSFQRIATPSEGLVTETWIAQRQVEQRVFLIRAASARRSTPAASSTAPSSVHTAADDTVYAGVPVELPSPVVESAVTATTTTHSPTLLREAHLRYVRAGLGRVSASYVGLHASQPWLLYWMLHALDLLGAEPAPPVAAAAVHHLRRCRHPSGGFGGGPGQDPHLATTYAAVAALVTIGTPDALDAVDPPAVRRFVRALARPDGSFSIAPDAGETDARALYSALAAAALAGVLDDDIAHPAARYARTLVAFDGGLAGEPGAEAHGGNTYCGVAAVAIAGALHVQPALDTEAILDWAAMKQCRVEGGFCGRTNKLVDSCYSFWVGALFPLLGAPDLFNADALQDYILTCCQDPRGGLRDKPGVQRDYHHTCYALSGLSVAQHYGRATVADGCAVRKVNVLYNVCEGRAEVALCHFSALRTAI
jgi:protein farnesyltransferase subunit beta